MPMELRINGYHWDRNAGNLIVSYAEGQDQHQLRFPDCQVCLDHGCGISQLTLGLHVTTDSERLSSLQALRGPFPWRHYQFLSIEGPFLEIISRSCQVAE